MSQDNIENSLRQNLPVEMHSVVPALAQILIELDSKQTTPAAVQSRLAADQRLSKALSSLASQRVEIADKLISFDGAQTGDITFGNVAGRDIIYQAKLTPEERLERRNRATLLELVRRFWIEEVLHDSLHQQVYIELGMQTRPDVVDHPWQTIIHLPYSEPSLLAPGMSILKVFKDAGERLLILGAPGSGKTTTLLVLAEALINEAISDEDQPIPVVLPFSTWTVKQLPLNQWLIEALAQLYNVPPNVSTVWVERGEILPLLDGFDEIGLSDTERLNCVDAINTYLSNQGGRAVICSRSLEYQRQGTKLQLETAVELQPLAQAQIKNYLEHLGLATTGLSEALGRDETLCQLATSPLLLSIMVFTYRDQPMEALMNLGHEQTHQYLWTEYVKKRFQQKRANAKTNLNQLQVWLVWLARAMTAHNQQVFYIEYLHSSWLPSKEIVYIRRVSTWALTVFFGIIIGVLTSIFISESIISLVFLLAGITSDDTQISRSLSLGGFGGGVSFGLIVNPIASFIGGLPKDVLLLIQNLGILAIDRSGFISYSSGLSGGMLGSLIGGLLGLQKSTQPTEAVSWSWRRLLDRAFLKPDLKLVLIGSLVGGSLGGLAGKAFIDYLTRYYAAANGSDILLVLGFAIGGALSGSLIEIVYNSVILSLQSNELEGTSYANEGIWRSMRSAMIGALSLGVGFSLASAVGMGLGLGMVGLLGLTLDKSLPRMVTIIGLDASFNAGTGVGLGVSFGLTCGMVLGFLKYGGVFVIKHFIERVLLRLFSTAPWNFSMFLDEAVIRNFMTRVGGGYRFYHRLLQEHFAYHEETTLPVAPILGPQKDDKTGGRRSE